MLKPGSEDVHEVASDTKKRAFAVMDPTSSITEDGSVRWRGAFQFPSRSTTDCPVQEALAPALTLPLHLKVGLTKAQMTRVRTQAGASVCDKLFVEDAESPCSELWEDAFLRVLRPTRCSGPTREREFHHAWSVLLRHLLATLLGDKCSFTRRDQNNPTSTDFALELDGVGVFHGEECVPLPVPDEEMTEAQRPDEGIVVAKRKLCDQLTWSYGEKVPYIIGYAASGFKCELFALRSADLTTVERTKIGEYDLEHATGRFELVLALLHLCRFFPAIAKLCSHDSRLEFGEMTRNDGVVVTLTPTQVVRDYTAVRSSYKGRRLRKFLAVSRRFWVTTLGFPHVERLVCKSASNLVYTFKPRGFEVPSQSLNELFHAIECVLTALVQVHGIGWMHRDIQWSNVCQYRNPARGWFLTDFVHGVKSPQPYPRDTHLREYNLAPEMSDKGEHHSLAVDLWSVGRLLNEWDDRHQSAWTSDKARQAFMLKLLDYDPHTRPTAAQALSTLQELRARSERSHEVE